MTAPPALSTSGLAGGYGRDRVVQHVDLTVQAGEVVGVVGPSGAGKTTLLRLLCGQADRHAGTVRVAGEEVREGRAPRRLGYVPQLGSVDWEFPLTVEQAVGLGLSADAPWRAWTSRAERDRTHRLLERVGLAPLRRRAIRELSGGQRQRLFLARALARDADLLLLDEPTSGVDVATRREVLSVLADLAADGVTVVLTTHDLNFVAAHLPRVACLHTTMLADGPPTEVLTTEVLRKTFGAELQVLRADGRVVVTDAEPVIAPAIAASSSLG